MNFMTWPMRLEYVCRLHKSYLIGGVMVLLFVPLLFWSLAGYWYIENHTLAANIQQLEEAGRANHEAVARYTARLKVLMAKDMSHTTERSMLMYMVDCANAQLVLDTITFTENGFIITGISTAPEVVLAYSQKLKSVLKGVTINEKQGIDAVRKVHTFQLSGHYGKSDDTKKTTNKASQ